MTFEEFEKFQEKLLEEVINMGKTKGREYAGDRDRFDNFNEDSRDLDLDRLKCAWVFASKHIKAIRNYIKEGKSYSNETIRGRLVDAITYLTLIAGMIEEGEVVLKNCSACGGGGEVIYGSNSGEQCSACKGSGKSKI